MRYSTLFALLAASAAIAAPTNETPDAGTDSAAAAAEGRGGESAGGEGSGGEGSGGESGGSDVGAKPKPTNAVPTVWDGECFYPKPDIGFDLTSYVGRWFQVAGTRFGYTANQKCVTAFYSANDDGTVRVNNTGQSERGPVSVIGTATPVHPIYGASGVFQVNFEGVPGSVGPSCPGPNYVVQDYTGDWSVVQSNNFSTLFILSRNPNPPTEQVDAWIKRAGLLGSDTSNIQKFDQTDCLPLD